MMELLKLKLTILEHFLVHRTFQIGHCKLDQLDSRVGVCQLHSSTRRIFGSQFRERILDVQQFDPFRHCIWCLSLGSGKYLRLGWPILKQVLKYLDVFQTVYPNANMTNNLPSAVWHPSRPAPSGQSHVPLYSSKWSPGVHLISIASPSIQLKKTLHTAGFG